MKTVSKSAEADAGNFMKRLSNQSARMSGSKFLEQSLLNLSGQLHGKFHQHLDVRYVVHWLGGHFVPKKTFKVGVQFIDQECCFVFLF